MMSLPVWFHVPSRAGMVLGVWSQGYWPGGGMATEGGMVPGVWSQRGTMWSPVLTSSGGH